MRQPSRSGSGSFTSRAAYFAIHVQATLAELVRAARVLFGKPAAQLDCFLPCKNVRRMTRVNANQHIPRKFLHRVHSGPSGESAGIESVDNGGAK